MRKLFNHKSFISKTCCEVCCSHWKAISVSALSGEHLSEVLLLLRPAVTPVQGSSPSRPTAMTLQRISPIFLLNLVICQFPPTNQLSPVEGEDQHVLAPRHEAHSISPKGCITEHCNTWKTAQSRRSISSPAGHTHFTTGHTHFITQHTEALLKVSNPKHKPNTNSNPNTNP